MFRRFLFLGFGGFAVSGLITPPVALALGLGLALALGNPFPVVSQRIARSLLQLSVVGLGAGMNLGIVWEAGRTGFGFTVVTIVGTLALGIVVGRMLKVEGPTSLLVSSGTAICGGSAIAAVGSVIDADEQAMSVSLATIFVLNAVALFVFPLLGRALGLGQQEFGVWSAIAIHDTSSVVGAAARYGEVALHTATTVKLVRALWIVPLVLGLSIARRGHPGRVSYPWFILFFLAVAALRTAVPAWESAYVMVVGGAKLGLCLTLFLIGGSLTRDAVQAVGVRPLVQGVILWIAVAASGLVAVRRVFG